MYMCVCVILLCTQPQFSFSNSDMRCDKTIDEIIDKKIKN